MSLLTNTKTKLMKDLKKSKKKIKKDQKKKKYKSLSKRGARINQIKSNKEFRKKTGGMNDDDDDVVFDPKFPKEVTLKEEDTALTNDLSNGLRIFNNPDLETVSLSSQINTIGYRAFYNCNKLREIKLNNNSHSDNIIPKSVIYIGKEAFNYCSSLIEIVIEAQIKKIERDTFSGCTSLQKIELKSNILTKIGDQAFLNCTSLKNVNIPDTVTCIDNNAFEHCIKLTSLELPGKLKIIGRSAFQDCTSLRNLIIPKLIPGDTLTFLGDGNAKLSLVCYNSFNSTIALSFTPNMFFKDWTNESSYIMTMTLNGVEIRMVTPVEKEVDGPSTDALLSPLVSSLDTEGLHKTTKIKFRFIGGIKLNQVTHVKVEQIGHNNDIQWELNLNKGCEADTDKPTITYKPNWNHPSGTIRKLSGSSPDTIIMLPGRLKEIGSGAFLNCRGITCLNIPENVEQEGQEGEAIPKRIDRNCKSYYERHSS